MPTSRRGLSPTPRWSRCVPGPPSALGFPSSCWLVVSPLAWFCPFLSRVPGRHSDQPLAAFFCFQTQKPHCKVPQRGHSVLGKEEPHHELLAGGPRLPGCKRRGAVRPAPWLAGGSGSWPPSSGSWLPPRSLASGFTSARPSVTRSSITRLERSTRPSFTLTSTIQMTQSCSEST